MTFYAVFQTDLEGNLLKCLSVPADNYHSALQTFNVLKDKFSMSELEIRELTLKTNEYVDLVTLHA